MADFGFLSDTDDSAVEELIAQAQELSVLEQVSAINCSGFTDSVLPTELESRFRRLKSFPLTKSNPKTSSNTLPKSLHHSKSELGNSLKGKTEHGSQSEEKSEIFSDSKQNPDRKIGSKKKSQSGYVSSPADSSHSLTENEIFSPLTEKPGKKKGLKDKSKLGSASSPSDSSGSLTGNENFSPSEQKPTEKRNLKWKSKSKSGSFSSPLGSSNSWMDLPSPPPKTGCSWCSPKWVSKKKRKENRVTGSGMEWAKNDEFLSDLSTFSVKEQQKMLKKAMKEEQKFSREAEKIVQWAKQASARMSFHGVEDELSDREGKN